MGGIRCLETFSCHRFTPSVSLLIGFHVSFFYIMNCANAHLVIKPATRKNDGLHMLATGCPSHGYASCRASGNLPRP